MQDINEILKNISPSIIEKFNSQENQLKLEGKIEPEGKIVHLYRYVVGLGERHFKAFENEIKMISDLFPWTHKKHIRLAMNELLINTQFSMLREVVKKVADGEKVPGYFFVTIMVNNDFFLAGAEEFGSVFDYFGFPEDNNYFDERRSKCDQFYDKVSEERVSRLYDLPYNEPKLVLTSDNHLKIADDSNMIGVGASERAPDYDFYICSFYKEDKYMWKRISFRIENDL